MKKESLDTALHLLRELYNINICVIDSSDSIHAFVSAFYFHKAQTAITAENITKIVREYPHDIAYITDSFFIHYLIFPLNSRTILMGPFCSMLLSSNDVRMIFNRYRISDLSVKDFFSYYNSFPVFTETQALHIIDALYTTVGCDHLPKIHKINNHTTNGFYDDFNDIKRENSIQLLEKRYSYEQRFLLDIENGNAKSALLDLHNMEADVKYLKQIGTTLENEKIGSAITRTTVRLAAMRANLPIYIIDQLSRENTIATFNAKNVDEIFQAKESMIRKFCTAIQYNKTNHYSALVQSILYYLDHNYYQDISLDEMASELSLSKKHIIAEFKKETGSTPIAYLRRKRLKQASVLLSGTNLTVQEVSASVGISDANYFIKLFKKEYGLTPHSYKKKFSST